MAANNSKKEIVLSNMDKIKEWLGQGVTMQAIAANLHVSKQTLYKYLSLDDIDAIKKARQPAVDNLENTMLKSAQGYTRKVKKYQKVKRTVYEDGKKAEEWEEMVEYEEEVYYPPDTTAGIFLLKNWAGYMNEPRAVDLRRREVELREKQAENNMW